MAAISTTINGRQFRLACEDGQEEHLEKLAQNLDQRIVELRKKFGEIGDIRLTVMASLTVADELAESMKRIRRLEEELTLSNTLQRRSDDLSVLVEWAEAGEAVDGDLARGEALVLSGRTAVRMVGGAAIMLVAAGLIEGFVSASAGDLKVRAAASAVSMAFLVAYLLNGKAQPAGAGSDVPQHRAHADRHGLDLPQAG